MLVVWSEKGEDVVMSGTLHMPRIENEIVIFVSKEASLFLI